MTNNQSTNNHNPLTEEEAFALLFGNNEIKEYRNDVFDEFGNYVFSTDITTNVPNTAIGTSSILSFIA